MNKLQTMAKLMIPNILLSLSMMYLMAFFYKVEQGASIFIVGILFGLAFTMTSLVSLQWAFDEELITKIFKK